MKDKIIFIVGGVVLVALFGTGILNFDTTVGWVRNIFYRAKGGAAQVGNTNTPVGNVQHAAICRENLHRIQAAKRKAAFDRGNQVGPITWEEVLHAMPDAPNKGKMTPLQIEKYMPKCPDGGNYSVGTLEEVPRCSISGQGSLTLEDDHVIRD